MAVAKKATVKKTTKSVAKKAIKKVAGKKVVVKKTVEAKKPIEKVAKAVSKTNGLSVPAFDVKGKAAGTVSLPAELFGQKVNKTLLAQAVRVYLANQRQGTAKSKTRGEVSYSTRKLWKQKGTGRARHGGRGAPLFVKGGTAHGAKLRDYSLSLSKNMKKAALLSALSSKVENVKVIKGFEKIEQKTRIVAGAFDAMGLSRAKILFVLPGDLENVYKAARNIEGITVTNAQRVTAYDILNTKTLVFMQEALATLEKRVKGEKSK